MKKTAAIFMIILFLFGCSRAPWIIKSDPPIQKIDNALYSIQFTPTFTDKYGYHAFDLSIENKTDQDIELVWDRTYYLQNGQTSGGFMFEGVIYSQRNDPKPPDILFPKKTFNKTIYPNILATFAKYWRYDQLPDGENGIYLSLKVKDVELREKLTVNIFAGDDESKRYKTIWGKVLQPE